MPTSSRLCLPLLSLLLLGCASSDSSQLPSNPSTTGNYSSMSTTKVTLDKPVTSDNPPIALSGYVDTSMTAQPK